MFSSDGSKIETYCQFNDQHCRVSVVIKAGVMQFTRPSHNFALCAMFQHVKAINKLIIVYNNALFRTLLLGALYPLCMSRLCPRLCDASVTLFSLSSQQHFNTARTVQVFCNKLCAQCLLKIFLPGYHC